MKYELAGQDPKTGLYRIRALRDIPRHGVKAGDIGGFVGSKKNLSQEDDAWIAGNAKVRGDAKVYGNAWVFGNAKVSDNAKVCGNAWIFDDATVCDDAWVYDSAWVSGNARIGDNAWISDNAKVCDNAKVHGGAWVSGNASVFGDASVYSSVKICGNARISKSKDYLSIGPIGIQDDFTTFYRTDTGIDVACKRFNGTIEEFEVHIIDNHENIWHDRDYQHMIALVRSWIGEAEACTRH